MRLQSAALDERFGKVCRCLGRDCLMDARATSMTLVAPSRERGYIAHVRQDLALQCGARKAGDDHLARRAVVAHLLQGCP